MLWLNARQLGKVVNRLLVGQPEIFTEFPLKDSSLINQIFSLARDWFKRVK